MFQIYRPGIAVDERTKKKKKMISVGIDIKVINKKKKVSFPCLIYVSACIKNTRGCQEKADADFKKSTTLIFVRFVHMSKHAVKIRLLVYLDLRRYPLSWVKIAIFFFGSKNRHLK